MKSPSLESINTRLQANKYALDVANQFKNPELLITKNSLSSSEKMSQSVITLKQQIPFYGKRTSREKVVLAQDALLEEQLNDAKVTLVERIKNEAYTIWELQELDGIIEQYIQLTEQNIELYEAYTSIDDNQHMGIMKAELSLSDLKIQRSTLKAKTVSAYARLSYLSATPIQSLEISLEMEEKPENTPTSLVLQNNPKLLIKAKEIQKQDAKVALADLDNYPDFNLIGSYAYRENFDNYFNLGVGISLPIYGTEDTLTQEQRALKLSVRALEADTKIALDAELNVYQAQMLSSYEIYHIVQDEALPQVAHMFELSSSSISTGGDLFKYIDVLFQKLSLEKKSIIALANYKRSQAKIAQLSGALQ
jgi:outer membrane protein TolC